MKIAFFVDSSSVGGGYYHMMNFVNLAKESIGLEGIALGVSTLEKSLSSLFLPLLTDFTR